MRVLKSKLFKNKALMGFGAAAVLVLFLLAAGTADAAQRGRLIYSDEVTESFTSFQPAADMNYYLAGRGKIDAVLGIHEDYRLKTSLWRGVNMTPEAMQRIVDRIDDFALICDTPQNARGFELLDSGGNRIGVWFSEVHQANITLLGNNEVTVYPPVRFNLGEDAE